MKVVVLASGGIDSSVLLHMLKKEKNDVFPLFVNYGHKAANQEQKAFKNICKGIDVKGTVIDLSQLGIIRTGLTDPKISAKDFPFFPARNLILISVGAAYTFSKASRIISLGFLKDSLFSDQRKEFVSKLEEVTGLAVGTDIKILTPFIEMNKAEVVKLAKSYRFPLDMTYSCHNGTTKPCGECMGCQEREKVIK